MYMNALFCRVLCVLVTPLLHGEEVEGGDPAAQAAEKTVNSAEASN